MSQLSFEEPKPDLGGYTSQASLHEEIRMPRAHKGAGGIYDFGTDRHNNHLEHRIPLKLPQINNKESKFDQQMTKKSETILNSLQDGDNKMFTSLDSKRGNLRASQSNRDLGLEVDNGAPRRNWGLENDDTSTKLLNRMNTKIDKMTSKPTDHTKKGYSKFVSRKIFM